MEVFTTNGVMMSPILGALRRFCLDPRQAQSVRKHSDSVEYANVNSYEIYRILEMLLMARDKKVLRQSNFPLPNKTEIGQIYTHAFNNVIARLVYL